VIAGNGEQGVVPTDGTATASAVTPSAIAVDRSGKSVYLADATGCVVKIASADLSIVAGECEALGSGSGSGNYAIVVGPGPGAAIPAPGPATQRAIGDIGAIALDSADNLYIGDFAHNVIEKVSAATDQLSIAVNGNTENVMVESVAVDSTNTLYIGDGEGYIRTVSPKGVLGTIAGNGTQNGPTPGLALQTGVNTGPLAVDAAGDVYMADWAGYVEKIVQ
jgi:hypothetical protein